MTERTVLDVETAIVTELLDAGVLGGHLSTRLPRDFETKLPYGTVRRGPGSNFVDDETRHLERARLQANTWGELEDDIGAFAAMDELLTGIVDLRGQQFAGLVATDVSITQTPQWLPDPDSHRPGYIAFVVVHIHPALPASYP